MKYLFCGRPIIINTFGEVYDRNGNCLGKDIKTPEFEHYLVGTANKGPITQIPD